MIQESEIINLILAGIAVFIILFVFRKKELPRFRMIYVGFSFMICAYVFTVLEGFVFFNLLNAAEHLCYALSGLSFSAGFLFMTRNKKNRKTV